MRVDKFNDIELYQRALDIERIGNEGVTAAKNENRRKGIASVYSINGRMLYELPDGTITTSSPFKNIDKLKK